MLHLDDLPRISRQWVTDHLPASDPEHTPRHSGLQQGDVIARYHSKGRIRRGLLYAALLVGFIAGVIAVDRELRRCDPCEVVLMEIFE